MNDIFNKVFGGTDTTKLTPIEIALGVDEKGLTTAGKLYEFLELNPAHYARWFKKNIMENSFAEINVDYFPFTTNGECGGQASQDAKLTAAFAKKLSMMQKNSKKGEAARNYFVGVENGAKKLIEKQEATYPIDAAALKGLASVGNLIRSTMKDENAKPYETAMVLDSLFKQGGLYLPICFIKIPQYEQMALSEFMR